jgi:hypothetical protein
MSKILKNTTGSTIAINDVGISISANSSYTIPPQDYLLWSASSNVIAPIGSLEIIVNDGSFDLSPSDGVDLLKGILPTDQVANPTITSLALTLANTEYNMTLPAGTRQFSIKSRTDSLIKIAYLTGQMSTNYVIMYPGSTYFRERIRRSTPLTMYFTSSKASDVLEVEYWT